MNYKETENEADILTDDFSTIWITRFALCILHATIELEMIFTPSREIPIRFDSLEGSMSEQDPTPGRKPRISDDEIIEIFVSTDDPVLSTAEVADGLPIQRRATLNRLEVLEDEGRLDSKVIGGRNRVWWVSESI